MLPTTAVGKRMHLACTPTGMQSVIYCGYNKNVFGLNFAKEVFKMHIILVWVYLYIVVIHIIYGLIP